ncbi:ribosomal RNA-processing protein 8 [Dendryphion nanum]|uniref:Ribosomal RNA-processing protein 8 n=1 Tax=Dendryphion nanum TaxID=256645 RepID=A0A9P9DKQ9_9PLEO|nr:ribosomal RNA-processing protein 8 [Dendryphion nanum]
MNTIATSNSRFLTKIMFAVPGWNVSAPLATQIEKAKPKDAPEGKKSQKRKRKQQEQQVDEGNVGEYWDRVIEGKDTKEKEKSKSREGKQTKETDANGTSEKDKKRKSKGGKDKETEESADTAQDNTTKTVRAPVSEANEAKSKPSKKKQKKEHKVSPSSQPTPTVEPTKPLPPSALLPEPVGLTPLQKSMRAKLTSARFRHLNESLYTKPSAESLSIFTSSPEMFEDYHRGFAQQVEVWPENPVDSYVSTILSRGKIRPKTQKHGRDRDRDRRGPPPEPTTDVGPKPLPRNFKGHSTIADLGCGTASLSHRLQSSLKPLNLTLHSFDLSKPTGPTGPLVTIADISALPLQDSSVDVAIFCLALMGTNWLDFIDEAWRILRWKGELWISEIKSRFGRVTRGKVPINSVGSLKKAEKPKSKAGAKNAKAGKVHNPIEDAELDSADEEELAHRVDGAETREGGTDVSAFVAALKKRGFVLDALPERQNDAIDLSNKMFVKLQFVKGVSPSRGKNVRKEPEFSGATGGTGANRVGLGMGTGMGLKPGMKKWRFGGKGDGDDEGGDEVDAGTLKPCLYKIR